MMLRVIFILFNFTILLLGFNLQYGGIKNPNQPIFCGREGHLYHITEPDMWEELVKKSKEVNETYFYSLMKKAFNRAFVVEDRLPICKNFSFTKFEPIFVVQRDIYANGVLLYKKGYSFNVLERLNKFMRVKKPLLYFGPIDNNVSKKIGLYLVKHYKNAIFAVTSGNLKKLAYKYPYKVAKANNMLINKFKINCNATIVVLGEKNQYNIFIPINKFSQKDFKYLIKKIDYLYKEFYE